MVVRLYKRAGRRSSTLPMSHDGFLDHPYAILSWRIPVKLEPWTDRGRGGRTKPMRILVVSDLHGDLGSVRPRVRRPSARLDPLVRRLGRRRPGDRAGAGGIPRARARLHDLRQSRPARDAGTAPAIEDGSPVLLAQGGVHEFGGLRLAAIGGIWAKSHAKPHYVTDADVAQAAARIARSGRSISCSPTLARSVWPTSRPPDVTAASAAFSTHSRRSRRVCTSAATCTWPRNASSRTVAR